MKKLIYHIFDVNKCDQIHENCTEIKWKTSLIIYIMMINVVKCMKIILKITENIRSCKCLS